MFLVNEQGDITSFDDDEPFTFQVVMENQTPKMARSHEIQDVFHEIKSSLELY